MSPKQVDSCFQKELIGLFNTQNLDINKINERNAGFIILCKKGKLSILIREKAKILKNKIITKNRDDIKELRGDVVCRGKIKGRAIKFTFGFDKDAIDVINRKVKKMKKGDIVIAESTGPELIMACRKAGAIITEEGGVNSHAAVIARELKIPAIVNTKIATQVINDGDLLEVDANNGIIKIITR